MEIVNVIEGTRDGFALFAAIVLVLAAIGLFIASIAAFQESEILAGTIALALAALCAFPSWAAIKDYQTPAPDKYEVIITDFNEVYEQGYEIVDQRGDIYVIQKSEQGSD